MSAERDPLSDSIDRIEAFISSLESGSQEIAVKLALSLATNLSTRYDNLPREEQDQMGRAFSFTCKTACLLSKSASYNLLLGRVVEAYAGGLKGSSDSNTQKTAEALEKLSKIVLTS